MICSLYKIGIYFNLNSTAIFGHIPHSFGHFGWKSEPKKWALFLSL